MARDVHDLYADSLTELARVQAELEQTRTWLSGKIQEIKRLKNSRENDLVLLEQLVQRWEDDTLSDSWQEECLEPGLHLAATELQTYIERTRTAMKE